MPGAHPQTRSREDLVPTISRLPAGRLRLVTGATAADVAAEVGRDESTAAPGAVVTWIRLGPSRVVDRLLAEAAESIVGLPPPSGSRHFLPEVVRRWLGVIAPATAVVLIDGPPPDQRSFAVAALDAAEKLAHAGAAVALFVRPSIGADDPYLRARYGELRFRPPPATPPPGEGGRELVVSVRPFAGAPHPMSRAERKLADAIAKVPDLEGLFALNVLVNTVHGTTPRVDLLCQELRIVVEIDGDEHAEPAHYAADRRRDVELVTSGHVVARFVNRDVLSDPDKVAAAIAAVVKVRRGEAK